jgi:hypothetical protein
MDILIFKTNLYSPERISQIEPVLQNIKGINRWNVDIHDCDNVLRIEATELSPRSIETILQEAGYFCEELQD